jgi:hypothetical protein
MAKLPTHASGIAWSCMVGLFAAEDPPVHQLGEHNRED